MFISHNYKLLFFEVPRTASRSITRTLTSLDPNSPTAVIRAAKRNLYHYHVYDKELTSKHLDYALIAVHRNPYDRIQSHFKYRKQHGNPNKLKEFSFEHYIDWVSTGRLPFEIGPAMTDKPIAEMLPLDQVTYWLRYEHLEFDWADLSQSLSFELPELVTINSSDSALNSQSIYTEDLANKIAKRFASDFEHFGYDLNSWRS